jgi:hypothetical protein
MMPTAGRRLTGIEPKPKLTAVLRFCWWKPISPTRGRSLAHKGSWLTQLTIRSAEAHGRAWRGSVTGRRHSARSRPANPDTPTCQTHRRWGLRASSSPQGLETLSKCPVASDLHSRGGLTEKKRGFHFSEDRITLAKRTKKPAERYRGVPVVVTAASDWWNVGSGLDAEVVVARISSKAPPGWLTGAFDRLFRYQEWRERWH